MRSLGMACYVVGAILGAVFLVWATIIGVYPDQLVTLLLLGGVAVALVAIGAKLNKNPDSTKPVQWKPSVPRQSGGAAQVARPNAVITPVAAAGPIEVSNAEPAGDPNTFAAQLADLAHRVPEVRALVAGNPAAYPGLLAWLAGIGDPAIDSALRARGDGEAILGAPRDSRPPAVQAADPQTPKATLAHLAYRNPELRGTVAGNPNAYPALLQWISAI